MKLKISVDGKTYDVDVEVAEEERPAQAMYYQANPTMMAPLPPMAAPSAAAPGGNVNEDKVCRSPIVGMVTRIHTQLGQQIQTNDPMLVLEAMKMETNITSPVVGKIKSINVKIGDPVQVGQILVEFE